MCLTVTVTGATETNQAHEQTNEGGGGGERLDGRLRFVWCGLVDCISILRLCFKTKHPSFRWVFIHSREEGNSSTAGFEELVEPRLHRRVKNCRARGCYTTGPINPPHPGQLLVFPRGDSWSSPGPGPSANRFHVKHKPTMKFSLRKCAQAGPAWPSNVAKAQHGTPAVSALLLLLPVLLVLPVLLFLACLAVAGLELWLAQLPNPCSVLMSNLILPCPCSGIDSKFRPRQRSSGGRRSALEMQSTPEIRNSLLRIGDRHRRTDVSYKYVQTPNLNIAF